MRRFVAMMVVLAAAALPAPARAQVNVGVRLGYAVGTGKVAPGLGQMAESFNTQLPVQLEVGYAVLPQLRLGVYGSQGNVAPDDGGLTSLCGMRNACQDTVTRVGVQAQWTFERGATGFAPWVGLGAGYEWARYKATGVDTYRLLKVRGFELLNVQLGTEYAVGSFAFGPFVQVGMGRYRRVKVYDGYDPSANEDGNRSHRYIHGWHQVGVRGSFSL